MAWQTLSLHFKQTYEAGYRYFDKCGEFMVAAADKLNFIPGEIKPTGAKMEIPEYGVNASCDANSLSISQELPPDDATYFLNLCKEAVALVATHIQPKSIVKNGFAVKTYWAFSNVQDMLAASLKVGGDYHKEAGKILGMIPDHKRLDYTFASGSKGLHVVVQPVSFERVNLTKQNAGFQASKIEKNRIDRRNKFADRIVNVSLSHAIILELDLTEDDPPEGVLLDKHFAELKQQSDKLRKQFIIE
jgi:hypothetical protein